MRAVLQAIRQRFHPLHHSRKSVLGRLVLRAADRPTWISVPGVRFKVRGQRLSHGLSYGLIGSQERNPQALALACVHQLKFRSFWDVGANFGYYSWLLKSAVPDLKVVLIEPLPANAELIRATIRRNRFTDVHLIEAGASASPGAGVLRADVLSGATSSLNDEMTFEQLHFGVAPKLVTVPLVSIDSVREQHGPVDFVKIDVEGHEAAGLQGAVETIARDQPVFFIECSHPGHQCLGVLESAGYLIVDGDKLSVGSSESINFFCFPPRYQRSIEALLHLARRS
jgi:FkbM family methyltransferase